MNALSSGAFQIQVQAAYQGQIATAAISQTNFATAAAAAQAGAGAGGGGGTAGATGGAAGGGGGLSATTIGIIGAAVGGGALAATQVLPKDEEENFDVYTGALTGQLIITSVATNPQGQQTSCDRLNAVTGSMSIDLREGNATGTARLQATVNEVSVTGLCGPGSSFMFSVPDTAVSGGPPALTFTHTATGPSTTTVVFNGSHSGSTITGTVRITVSSQGTGAGTSANLSGSTTLQVTLQK